MSEEDRAVMTPGQPDPNGPGEGQDTKRAHGTRASGVPRAGRYGNNSRFEWPSQKQGNENAGWMIISYLAAGMFIYGGLGWLIGHLIGQVAAATLAGLVIGVALAITLVIYRYGRS
jgi:ATP synthase protein I